MKTKISVIGDGAWGTALGLLLDRAGYEVWLWGAFPDYIHIMLDKRENIKYLPGADIPMSVRLTSDLDSCIEGASLVVLAVPSQYMRDVCKRLKPVFVAQNAYPDMISVSKGIENKSLMRMTQVIEQTLYSGKVAVLSGPTHAEEVVLGTIPSAAVIAADNRGLCEKLQHIFCTDKFRVYTSTDVAGVELGGALKNVIAIAAGICDGLGFGDNTKAALITRGVAEMTRLGVAMGADPFTFSGLSGMGDLIVTCTSKHSRNRGLGEKIGAGMTLDEVLSSTEKVAEGVRTCISVKGLSQKYGVETPIAQKVYEILYENRSCMDALEDLMLRSPRPEKDRQ